MTMIAVNPLDRIIAQSVIEVLEKDLGKRTYKKIEEELLDVYGLTILDAARDFSKLDLILRKFFGPHVVKLELQIFKKILSVERKNKRSESSIIIKDPLTAKMIFESYGDPEKKVILDILLNESKSIPETIGESKLPQASTYRRTRELIRDGLITLVGHSKASDGRKVNEYETTFNRAIFEVRDKSLSVSIKLQNRFLQDSFAYNSLLES